MRCDKSILIASAFSIIASTVSAEVCDYRLSQFVGGYSSGAIAGATGSTAAAGTAMQAAGFYTLVHAGSGLTMLGSTAEGASAAGTVGIMGGTGGVIGTAAAFLMSPFVIGAAAVVAVGTAGFEGVCYFRDERITDYDQVLSALEAIIPKDDVSIRLEVPNSIQNTTQLSLRKIDGSWATYKVEKLYIVEGVLMHSDRFTDTKIGSIGVVAADSKK